MGFLSGASFIVLKTDGTVTKEHIEAIRRVYPNAKLILSRKDIKIPGREINNYEEYTERLKEIKG